MSLTQVLVGLGLVAVGVGIGARLAPVFRHWTARALPSAPPREIDRWANEGGAVAPPAFPKQA